MEKQTLMLQAPAKLNLTLEVAGKRADGYHDLRTIMQSVSLCDSISLTVSENGDGAVSLAMERSDLPQGEKNLAVAAALALRKATGCQWGQLAIVLKKRIPVCAGMAGGSTDAAAVLRGLNQLLRLGLTTPELAAIGASVGSDVPYCVWGGTAFCTGRGELVEPLPSLPECCFVLLKPDFSISTPALFAQLDRQQHQISPDTDGAISALRTGNLTEMAKRMENVFENVLPATCRKIVLEMKQRLFRMGALGACMTGTGSTVYGLFSEEGKAQMAYVALRSMVRGVFLCRPQY